ncbi:MAG: DNA-binding protein [Gammaproteobacteria bacterium]|nr:MAG: DNA-binding protein [Gammaproteobacteria bacterium]
MAKNYYDILGIKPTATDEQVKNAYRHLVRLHHPDVSKDPNASLKIAQINNAYEALKDADKRNAYNQANPTLFAQSKQQTHPRAKPKTYNTYNDSPLLGSDSFNFDAVFSAFGKSQTTKIPPGFNNYSGTNPKAMPLDPTKGANKFLTIQVPLTSIYKGDKIAIKAYLPTRQRNGNVVDEPTNLMVNIAKGTKQGQLIRIAKHGEASEVGGENGDLILKVNITHANNIVLQGSDVYQTINITTWEAFLGDTINIESPAGNLSVNIPANSQTGDKIRLPAKGIPSNPAGNLFIVLKIINPKATNQNQLAAIKKLKKVFANTKINRQTKV